MVEKPAEGPRKGAVVMIAGQVAMLAVSMVSLVTLSRMLPPSDFGLIAMVNVFLVVGALFTDLGLSTAALRAKTLHPHQASNLFWVNGSLALIAAVVLALGAPVIAAVYGEPRLAPISVALAVGLFGSGLQAQFQVQMARSGKFTSLAFIGAFSSFIALVVAIIAASAGLGYWALVLQSIVASYIGLILKAVASKFRPSRFKRNVGTRELVVSGANFAGAGALHQMSASADSLVIGIRWNPVDVGVFSRAKQIADLPITLLTPLLNVMIPALSEDIRRGMDPGPRLLKLQSALGVIGMLVLVPVAVAAPTLFPLVLGENWGESAFLFRLLALGTAARVLTQISHWAFITVGSSREWLKYNVLSKLMATGLIVAGVFISLPAVALFHALGNIFAWLLNVAWLDRTTILRGKEFYLNGLRLLMTALVAAGASMLLPWASLTLLPWSLVACQMLVSATLFALLLLLTKSGRADFHQVLSLIRRR